MSEQSEAARALAIARWAGKSRVEIARHMDLMRAAIKDPGKTFRDLNARLTHEQRSAAAKKMWATRKANKTKQS